MGKSSEGSKRKFYRKIIPNKDETPEEDKSKEQEKKEKKDFIPPVSFHKLFQFATTFETLMVVFGCLMAILSGTGMPVLIILFGDVTNAFVYNAIGNEYQNLSINSNASFNNYYNNSNETSASNFSTAIPMITTVLPENEKIHLPPGFQQDFLVEVRKFGLYTVILGIVQLIAGYLMILCLNSAAERQIFRIRVLFLKSVLRQDIAWYDEQKVGEFSSRSIADLNKLQDGIGEKLGMYVFFMTNFVVDMIIAFVHGWKLTLVILSVMPVLTLATAAFMKIQTTMTNDEMKAYSKAGTIAEEVFCAVKTVFSYGGQEKETERFLMKEKFKSQRSIKALH